MTYPAMPAPPEEYDPRATPSYGTAVLTCLRKSVRARGRASRAEFWCFVMFCVSVFLAVGLLGALIGGEGLATIFFVVPYLLLMVPWISAGMTLLTVDEHNPTPSKVRLGREIYTDRPFLPADRIRQAGAEYVNTGHLPQSVTWQRRATMVPQGPFGKRLVAEEDLPPKLEWSYPKQAQPWAHDPAPLPITEDGGEHVPGPAH